MVMYEEDAKVCYYCKKDMTKSTLQSNDLDDNKVRDHNYLNGKYRGAAHNSCNLNANKFRYNFVPLVPNMKII